MSDFKLELLLRAMFYSWVYHYPPSYEVVFLHSSLEFIFNFIANHKWKANMSWSTFIAVAYLFQGHMLKKTKKTKYLQSTLN